MSAELPIVCVSPYYDPRVPSGANRRIDEICSRFLKDFGERFTLVVSRGMRPGWWAGANLIEVDYRFTPVSRLFAARQVAKCLEQMPRSIVISDWIPIPFRALRRHVQFQTAWDFRHLRAESKSMAYRLLFGRYLRSQWRRSQFMVTCSEFSIDELGRFTGFPRQRVIKTYFGINEKIFRMPRGGQKEYDLIYVGHFDKHKNHAPLIDAMALVDRNIKALFVGCDNGLKGELVKRAAGRGLSNVTFMTVRDEQHVWELYTKSRLFVSPSLYEGFGMPTIEALALGLPVALADIPVFHEVAGDLASYFDPHSPSDIAAKLSPLLAAPSSPDPERVKRQLEPYLWSAIYGSFVDDLFCRAHAHCEQSSTAPPGGTRCGPIPDEAIVQDTTATT